MEGGGFGIDVLPAAIGVDEAGVAASASSVLLTPEEGPPVGGVATRVLKTRTSRERSPRGVRAVPPATSPSASSQHGLSPTIAGLDKFAVGQAVVLVDLVSRQDLVGKCGVVKSFDPASKRYAVCLDISGEHVKVLESNLHYNFVGVGVGSAAAWRYCIS